MVLSKQRFGVFLEWLLPWTTLLFIGFNTFALFILQPYTGIELNNNTVVYIYTPSPSGQNFQMEDSIIKFGSVTLNDISNDLTLGYLNHINNKDSVEVIVKRQGKPVILQYTLPGINWGEFLGRLNSQWFTPYVFWLAGTVSLLFLRPRNRQRLLLILFCYVTSAWLSSGFISAFHFLYAALSLRSLVWLSVPIYLHLHWIFPTPLKQRLPSWVWGLVDTFSIVMAAASWMQWVHPNFYLVGVLIALLGSIILLGVHLVTQPAERRTLLGLVIALGISLLPVLGYVVLGLFNIHNIFDGLVILGLAAIPGFYFFTLYRHQLTELQNLQTRRLVGMYVISLTVGLLVCVFVGLFSQLIIHNIMVENLGLIATLTLLVIAIANFIPFLVLPALADEHVTLAVGGGRLSFSANRAASGVIFLMLEALVVLVLTVGLRLYNFPGVNEVSLLLAALVMGVGALVFYPAFKHFFERTVLGITISPETLTKTYSGRITTSLEALPLQKLLLEEVFPSLLVRQFAQVLVRDGGLTLDFGLRVTPDMLPHVNQMAHLETLSGKTLDRKNASLPTWIRVVVPLRLNQQTSGYWLLGQRDPDDHYSEDDIATLQALADQTALALVNIQQADNLRAFYFADIDRNEVERTHLAAELHDDVLSQMAVLSQNLVGAAPAALEAYDQAVMHIREIINGLRPAMLNFGVQTALENLADELNSRLPDGPELLMEISPCSLRYDPRLELYLFRIVQQACNNAIHHAQCRTIRISGNLTTEMVELTVSDDGQGFASVRQINLPNLRVEKHFGLAGMFERAALIEADLDIQSQPGQGCQVHLKWAKK